MGAGLSFSSQILHLVYLTFSSLSPFSSSLIIIDADNNEPSLNVELKLFITPFFKSP